MKIGIITKVWGRKALTEIVLRYYAEMDLPHIDLVGSVAVSPDDPEHALTDWQWPGWNVVMVPNEPLGDKGQAAMHHLAALHPDIRAVINIGSDDLLTPQYIRDAISLALMDEVPVIPSGLAFYDLPTGRAMLLHQSARIGAGRVIPRACLEALRWRLWPERSTKPDKGMDVMLDRLDAEPAFLGATGQGGRMVLDVKTPHNIGTYDAIRSGRPQADDVGGAVLLRTHFPGVADDLLALREREAA